MFLWIIYTYTYIIASTTDWSVRFRFFPFQWKQPRDTRYEIDTNFNAVCREKGVPNGGDSMFDVQVIRGKRETCEVVKLFESKPVTNGDTVTRYIVKHLTKF